MSDTILEVEALTCHFSGLVAVDSVSFSVRAGSVTGLIGPNGAGKTTCFNLITGSIPPSEGRIRFRDRDITGLPPETICTAGLVRTFQVVRPLPDMTVLENATIGALNWTNRVKIARNYAFEMLEKVGLQAKAEWSAKWLTLPDLKMLELARALATKPRMLLLDEVMAGLRPNEANLIVEVLRELNRGGLTLLLVEHVMRIVMSLTQQVIVLHHGQKIFEGAPEDVIRNQLVIESYLGRKSHV